MSDDEWSFVVEPGEAGQRFDQLVRRRLPQISRRLLNELFARGEVSAERRSVAKGQRARAGTRVAVLLPPEDRAMPNPDLPLSIVAEGAAWVMVSKPAGIASAARDGRDATNVASALVARYPAMVGFGHHPREAGLIQRLDTGTSGLLLAAKHERAFAELSQALRAGRLRKRYLALAPDVPYSEGRIHSGVRSGRGARVEVTDLEHHPLGSGHSPEVARTSVYRVIERRNRVALIELSVGAAYRHQIRAQLAAIGCPILGDARYGSALSFPRHALHASWLAYAGGAVVDPFEVHSPLPDDIEGLWQRCSEDETLVESALRPR